MMKDEIEKKNNFKKRPKKDQSQPLLTLKTHDPGHKSGTNIVDDKP
jgi:hypothetical protein